MRTLHIHNVPILGKVDIPVANSAGIVQAVLGDVWLEMCRSTAGATLRADVRRLVLVDSLVWQKTALVWEKHLANSARFLWTQRREERKTKCLNRSREVTLADKNNTRGKDQVRQNTNSFSFTSFDVNCVRCFYTKHSANMLRPARWLERLP